MEPYIHLTTTIYSRLSDNMIDFSTQIFDFQKTGEYDYEFDEGGNLPLNEFSLKFNEHYVSLPLSNIEYKTDKIVSFNDIAFVEFIPNQ